MKKYLIIADTYPRAYGVEYHLFGIFDTREEAVDWILNHPIVVMGDVMDPEDEEGAFDFFENYDSENHRAVLYRNRNGEIVYEPMSRESYAMRYVVEFNGSPMHIGGYQE